MVVRQGDHCTILNSIKAENNSLLSNILSHFINHSTATGVASSPNIMYVQTPQTQQQHCNNKFITGFHCISITTPPYYKI